MNITSHLAFWEGKYATKYKRYLKINVLQISYVLMSPCNVIIIMFDQYIYMYLSNGIYAVNYFHIHFLIFRGTEYDNLYYYYKITSPDAVQLGRTKCHLYKYHCF